MVRLPAALPDFVTGADMVITSCVSTAVQDAGVGTTRDLSDTLIQAVRQCAQAPVVAPGAVMTGRDLAGFAVVAYLQRRGARWPWGR